MKVAESLSRAFTGRKVRAGLVGEIRRLGEGKPLLREVAIEPVAVDQPLRRAVLRGMWKVAMDGGTARSLAGTIKTINQRLDAEGLRIAVYGKTGTQELLYLIYSRVAKAVDRLIKSGRSRIRYEKGRFFYANIPLEAPTGERPNHLIRAIGEAMSAPEKRLLADVGVDAAVRFLLGGEKRLIVKNRRVVGAKATGTRTYVGARFSFVIGLYEDRPVPPEAFFDPILNQGALKRALSVSIFFEHDADSSLNAVLFARKLLDGPLLGALQEGW